MKPRSPSAKPLVAHLIHVYLDLSDTFIYQYLKHLRHFQPVVIVERMENLERFPLEAPIHALNVIWDRGSWPWLRGTLERRLLRRDPLESQAWRILKETRPRLIHAHFGPQGYWALGLRRRLDVPLITTFYGMDMSELPRERRWREAYARLFEEGDTFLVEGPHMRESLIQLGCPAEKVRIQHIAIEVDAIPFRPRNYPQEGPVRLLLCGRFTEKKGIEYAILALAKVREVHPNVQMRLIGDGERRPRIEALLADLNLEDAVCLLGYQPYGAFLRELQEAHLFLAPSVTAANGDSEGGAPTVLLEAQAAGLPVVATRHADIPEVVRDGKSGFLVSERDPEALADRLIFLLEHPEMWGEIGLAGRRHVEENHNIILETRKLENIYAEQLRPPP